MPVPHTNAMTHMLLIKAAEQGSDLIKNHGSGPRERLSMNDQGDLVREWVETDLQSGREMQEFAPVKLGCFHAVRLL